MDKVNGALNNFHFSYVAIILCQTQPFLSFLKLVWLMHCVVVSLYVEILLAQMLHRSPEEDRVIFSRNVGDPKVCIALYKNVSN